MQIYNAENIKKELQSRFLDEKEINQVSELLKGFPFNDYDINKVQTGIKMAGKPYCKKFNINETVIKQVLDDIENQVYLF